MNTERIIIVFFMAPILLLNIATEAKEYPMDYVLKNVKSFFQGNDPHFKSSTEIDLAGTKISLEGIEVKGLEKLESTIVRKYEYEVHKIHGGLIFPEIHILIKNVNKDKNVKYIENLQIYAKKVFAKVSGLYNPPFNNMEYLEVNLQIHHEMVTKSYVIDGKTVEGNAVENEPAQIITAYFKVLEKELYEKLLNDFNEGLKLTLHVINPKKIKINS